MTSEGPGMEQRDILKIMELLPHRYPFLMVDRIVSFERGERIHCRKNVTINEPFFQGHFPGAPVMPGVLIIEAMAQAAALLVFGPREDRHRKLIFFSGIDEARFRRPVVPGDVLDLELEILREREMFCKMRGLATVEGEKAAEAVIMASLVDRPGA